MNPQVPPSSFDDPQHRERRGLADWIIGRQFVTASRTVEQAPAQTVAGLGERLIGVGFTPMGEAGNSTVFERRGTPVAGVRPRIVTRRIVARVVPVTDTATQASTQASLTADLIDFRRNAFWTFFTGLVALPFFLLAWSMRSEWVGIAFLVITAPVVFVGALALVLPRRVMHNTKRTLRKILDSL